VQPFRPLLRKSSPDLLPVAAAAAALAVLAAIAIIFMHTPIERSMGIVQKIFYFHVPGAISAYMGFGLCCIASVAYLITGRPQADALARAGAEVGVLFCAFVLVSGPLWARKAWGTFWTGEPRLMLTLVLFLIFCAYILVSSLGGRSEMTRKICAVLAILGVVDIPLVRVSVSRWRGNHPQVVTGDGGGLAPSMQAAFTAGFVAVALLFVALVWLRYRVALGEEDVERLHRVVTDRRHRLDDLTRAAST
jgi:heme exporter protein C